MKSKTCVAAENGDREEAERDGTMERGGIWVVEQTKTLLSVMI